MEKLNRIKLFLNAIIAKTKKGTRIELIKHEEKGFILKFSSLLKRSESTSMLNVSPVTLKYSKHSNNAIYTSTLYISEETAEMLSLLLNGREHLKNETEQVEIKLEKDE